MDFWGIKMNKIYNFIYVLIALVCLCGIFSAGNTFLKRPDMKSIESVLKSNKIEHYIFSNNQNNKFVVIPKFGARILAVSVGGENLFWTHPDILKGQGGQRTWVSPEGGPKGFIFKPDWKGNRDFSMMDPGQYEVELFKENECIKLTNSFNVISNDGKEHYELKITRKMQNEEDPLRDDSEFESIKYEFLGIDFVHKMKNESTELLDRILALWCLIQVPPKGTMIVPVKEINEEAWRGNYFEPIPEEYVKANPGSFSFFIHGSQRYKVGINPRFAQAAICYVSQAEDDDYFMVLMKFPVKPEFPYVDKPKNEQEADGDAIQIYSHLEKGELAFGELECHSWGLHLCPGEEKEFPIKIFMYKAPRDVLCKIGNNLVCSNFDKAHIF